MHSQLAHCSNHNNTRRPNDTAITFLAFYNHGSAFLQFMNNGGSLMLTCALYYCSIVVNTDSNWLRFSGTLFRHRTSNNIRMLSFRIWSGTNNFYITAVLQECFDLLKSFLLFFLRSE